MSDNTMDQNGTEEIPLWNSLHDGELQSIKSDRHKRTLILEFDIRHIRKSHELADDYRFVWKFEDVISANAVVWIPWERVSTEELETLSNDANSVTLSEQWSKGHKESASWEDLETELSKKNSFIDVGDATFHQSEQGITLDFQGRRESDDLEDCYRLITIHACSISLSGSDGVSMSLEEFIQLGTDYWDAFEKRSHDRKTSL